MTQEQRSSVNNYSVLCCVYTGSTSGHAAPPPQNKHTHTHTQTHTPNTHTPTHTHKPQLFLYICPAECAEILESSEVKLLVPGPWVWTGLIKAFVWSRVGVTDTHTHTRLCEYLWGHTGGPHTPRHHARCYGFS